MSQSTAHLDVVAMGACSALGLSAPMIAARYWAGHRAFEELEVEIEPEVPLRGAILGLLPAISSREERIAALAAQAMEQLLLKEAHRPSKVDVILGLPSAWPGRPTVEARKVALLIQSNLGIALRPTFVSGGRCALFNALEVARKRLTSAPQRTALVVVADSLCDLESQRALVAEGRGLGGSITEGILCGEGAAAFLLSSPKAPQGLGELSLLPMACRPPFGENETVPGSALTQVFQAVADHLPQGARVSAILDSQTGERTFASDFTMAYLRTPSTMPEPLCIRSAAQLVGDGGAASAGLLLGCALSASSPLNGPELLYGIDDSGLVGGVLVRRTEPSLRKKWDPMGRWRRAQGVSKLGIGDSHG